MNNEVVNEWIMHEYKILSDHYFHEDNYYLKTNVLFLSLNAAMFGFISGRFAGSSPATDRTTITIFSIIGLISSLSWMLSLLRTHAYRNMIEVRIAEIEDYFSNILKIRTKRDELPLYARIPSSVAMLVLPLIFVSIWMYIAIFS